MHIVRFSAMNPHAPAPPSLDGLLSDIGTHIHDTIVTAARGALAEVAAEAPQAGPGIVHARVKRHVAAERSRESPTPGPTVTKTSRKPKPTRETAPLRPTVAKTEPKTTRKPKAPPAPPGPKRSASDLAEVTEKFLGYVREHPWSTMEQIQIGLGLPLHSLRLPVARLRGKDGEARIQVRGQKRAMQYAVVGETALPPRRYSGEATEEGGGAEAEPQDETAERAAEAE